MSGKKFDQKKAPISLIPREAIEEEAKALAFGANKYGRYNFREGIEYTRLIDAALRHILAIADGEDLDEESQCFHAGNARANLGMLLYMMKHKPEKDDRYKPKGLVSNTVEALNKLADAKFKPNSESGKCECSACFISDLRK